MQLLWHSAVNLSFGFLMLIAVVRILQELLRFGSSIMQKSALLKCAENPLTSELPALKKEPAYKP